MRGFPEIWLTWLSAVLFALCVLGYPVAGLIAAVMDWPSRWTSVPFRGLVALIALTVALPIWRSQPLNKWHLLLCVWFALYLIRLSSNVFAGHPSSIYEVMFFCLAVVLPVFAFFKCNLGDIERKVLVLIIWLSAGILMFSIAGAYLNWFGDNNLTYAAGRLSLTTLNPITLGNVAGSLILASLVWNKKTNCIKLLIFFALISLGLLAIGFTSSRGSFVALISSLAVLLVATPWSGREALVRLSTIFCIMCLAIWFMWKPPLANDFVRYNNLQKGFSESIDSRMDRIEILKRERLTWSDAAANTRWVLFKSSLYTFLENPVFGASNWTANKGVYPHNLIIEAFQNLGIAGGGMFLLLLVVGGFRAWERIRLGEHMVLPLLFFQALVGGQFSGSLYGNVQLWSTLVLLLGSSFISKSRYG